MATGFADSPWLSIPMRGCGGARRRTSNPSSEQMRPSLFIRPKIGAGAEAAASSGKNLRYAPP
eukprot:scaffold7994_cov122-Isochrysis_galbana.AAC.5